jgi:hypothetical protein
MLFKSAVFAGLMASVASAANMSTLRAPPSDFTAPVDSKIGRRLMSSARMLEQNQQQAEQGDPSFMYNYYIKYQSCASLIQVRGENGGGGGGKDEGGILYTQNLVKFSLCPKSSSCSSCGDGVAQYVVNMNEFIDAYTEAQLEAQELACENVREYCYCENANDDQMCENQCYYDQGMDYCVNMEGDAEFEIQRYLECAGKFFDRLIPFFVLAFSILPKKLLTTHMLNYKSNPPSPLISIH